MIELRSSCGIEIPDQYKDMFWVSMLLNELTRQSKRFDNPDVVDTNIFYETSNNGIIKVPRLIEIKNEEISITKDVTFGQDINIEFTSTLRNKLQEQAHDYLCTHDNGILKLKPGEGKTVISISAICELKKKALIFVHKDSLVTQWKERFLQHTNVKNEDIGILESSKYKEIIRKPIVIGTVQTMCSMIKRYLDVEKDFYDANFGIAIWDECHTTGGAPFFSKSIYYVPAKRCFGLSATPARSDHNDDIIGMHLGKVFEPEGISNTLAPKVIMVYFDHRALMYHRYYIMFGPPDKTGKKKPFPLFDPNRYKQMLFSKKNTHYVGVVNQLIRYLNQRNRNTLIICDRIKLLDQFAVGLPKEDVGFFLPRSGKDRDNQLHKKIVFSTPGSSRDGTDNPDLDCLIMATPIGNLDQAIGRVCRYKENKPRPIVLDLVDTGCPEMDRWGKRRKEFYINMKKDGWELDEKYLN